MRAFIAPTDRDWFDSLSSSPGIDEANFWMPNPWGGAFNVLRRGEPLLFKLKAPINAIVGGGFFQHYTELPVSLAWDAFGIKNGTQSRQALWERTARLRGTGPSGTRTSRSAASFSQNRSSGLSRTGYRSQRTGAVTSSVARPTT